MTQYIISYHRNTDPAELPLAVCNSLRAVSRWLGVPKSTVCLAFSNNATYAIFGLLQVEKITL